MIKDLIRDNTYNTGIELNATCGKGWTLYYISADDGTIKKWEIPAKKLSCDAKQGKIFTVKNRKRVDILKKSDISIYRVFQAVMKNEEDMDFKNSISADNWKKIFKIQEYMFTNCNMPEDIPEQKRTVYVAGMFASRGMTIMNKETGFVMTSAVITETGTNNYGGNDYQRLGRVCGYLRSIYQERKMKLIASTAILRNSIANTTLIREKAAANLNSLIRLKDFMTYQDWRYAKDDATRQVKNINAVVNIPVETTEDRIRSFIIKWETSLTTRKPLVIAKIFEKVKTDTSISRDPFINYLERNGISKNGESWWCDITRMSKGYGLVYTKSDGLLKFTDEALAIIEENA